MIISGYSRDRSPEPSAPPPGMAWKLPLSLAPDLPSKRLMPNLRVRDDAGWMSAANVAGCPTSAAFLARTSGLDAPHIAAYNDLICGLVDDGLWTKFDVLYIFATQDTTTAKLNLVSTNYNGVLRAPTPIFTADRGYTGSYVDPIFNAFSSPSPNFVQNSAHISLWETVDNNGPSFAKMGISIGAYNTDIFAAWTDGNAYFFVNSAAGVSVAAPSPPTGHYIANRSSSVAVQGYRNGSSIASSGANASQPIVDGIISIGAQNHGAGAFDADNTGPLAMASIGSSLSAGEVTLFYNRLRTYMTAVGVP